VKMNNIQEPRNTHQQKTSLSKGVKVVLGFALVIFIGSVGFLFGYSTPRTIKPAQLPTVIEKAFSKTDDADKIDISIFETVWNQVQTNYLRKNKVSVTDEYYGILKGLMASLGDPYSVFFNPKETQEFANDLAGSFEGIGAEISIREEKLVIVTPLKGSPAEEAGLQPNDVIFKIDGEMTDYLDLETAVSKIRGPEDSTVLLTIIRGDAEPKDYTVIRKTIKIDSVHEEVSDGIATITLTSFNDDTIKELDSAVQDILLKDPKGIILDLRNNPGGLLDVSVKVANVFLPTGSVVVIERAGDGAKTTHKTTTDGKLKQIPLVVLVNEGSASAAEIVAGALKDLDRAKLVGEKTFGKGTVQTYEVLPDGSSLKLTIAEWLTPLGDSFDGAGIEPDTVVEMTNEDYTNDRDPQMDQALQELQ